VRPQSNKALVPGQPLVGPLIRARRRQLHMTLQTLADAAGISVGYVSQVERDLATPSLGTLALIARAAEGSMRDSLSLLDQVIAFSGNQVSVESVRDSIGLIGSQTLVGILRGVFQKKPVQALALIEDAYS